MAVSEFTIIKDVFLMKLNLSVQGYWTKAIIETWKWAKETPLKGYIKYVFVKVMVIFNYLLQYMIISLTENSIFECAISILTTNGSSHQRCPIEKVFLKIFAKFVGKQLCQSPYFNKVAGLNTCVLMWILRIF